MSGIRLLVMVTDAEERPRKNRGPAAAAENRRALVAAARAVFADDGFAVPFSAIARRAGVGQGSLYRHFPTKIALAAAVFDDDIDEMERLASSSDATFDGLLDLVVARAAVSAALIDAITAERDQLVVQHLGIRMSELVSRVIARDIEAGRMSPDVDARDALTAVSMLARIVADALPDERPDTAVRARRVVTHGLRPRAVGSRG